MQRLLMFLFLYIFPLPVIHAQYVIRFYNPEIEKSFFCKAGDHIKLEYKGYLLQNETDEGFIMSITSEDVLIRQGNIFKKKYRIISLNDITGFKRYSVVRDLSKNFVQIGVFLGSFFTLKNIFRKNDFSDIERLGLSTGIGITGALIVKSAFPDKIKYHTSSGWLLQVIDDKGNILTDTID